MKIVKAKDKDLNKIVDIEYNCNKQRYNYKSKNIVRKLLSACLKKSKFYIIKAGNKILGYIVLNKSKKKGIIEFIAVHKLYHRKGIGSKLINFAKDYFKKYGCNKVCLSVLAENCQAISFYAAHKFKITKKYKRKNRLKLDMQADI